MDTTATRTRRIWELPLLLQVPKLKTTTRAHRICELPLLLQVSKLKTTPILHYNNHQLILLYKKKPYNSDIVLWEEPKKFYHELKLFKTYHSTMDTTATRTRRIWELPLLLQVPKLKTTTHLWITIAPTSIKIKNDTNLSLC